MNNLQFISDYKDNAEYRLSFNQLAYETFEIDFEKWYQAGFWNDQYICYSYVDGNKVVSNVSVNKLTMILNGEEKSALQIGTVMTHPDYRKRGLAGSLLKIVLEEYQNQFDIIYLFPDDDALDFYRKFGFASYTDVKFLLDVQKGQSDKTHARRLDFTNKDDQNLLLRLAAERTSLSRTFGVDDAQHILIWYSMGMMAEWFYYLEEDDLIVVCKRQSGLLQVFDVISREKVNFYDVLQKVTSEEITRVAFYFTPDFADTDLGKMSFESNEIVFFKPETIEIAGVFAHPITAHA